MEKLGRKLFSWASILDGQTLMQAARTAEMPFIYPHLALMPDAHLGKGATVGSVIPTERAIMPAAVGVDIGCGMIALRTHLTLDEVPSDRRELREAIERAVPLSAGGYNQHITSTSEERLNELDALAADAGWDPKHYSPNWELQLGSLGSGNHFIEVSIDEDHRVWLFLHSGSRGVGNKIAQHWIGRAQDYCRRNWIQLPDPDLAYLVEGTAEFDGYMTQLRWAQRFAFLNRAEMMDRVLDCFTHWIGGPVEVEQAINCHHNYTEPATVYGRQVWLSRKGAIDAELGVAGLIPGSMGTASYVVEGKGNPAALWSSPHGAGREYSRTAARKTFTREQLDTAMEGIEWRHTDAFLDEIPQAYKPIDRVMADAAELVTVKHTLRQIINVKGD